MQRMIYESWKWKQAKANNKEWASVAKEAKVLTRPQNQGATNSRKAMTQRLTITLSVCISKLISCVGDSNVQCKFLRLHLINSKLKLCLEIDEQITQKSAEHSHCCKHLKSNKKCIITASLITGTKHFLCNPILFAVCWAPLVTVPNYV